MTYNLAKHLLEQAFAGNTSEELEKFADAVSGPFVLAFYPQGNEVMRCYVEAVARDRYKTDKLATILVPLGFGLENCNPHDIIAAMKDLFSRGDSATDDWYQDWLSSYGRN